MTDANDAAPPPFRPGCVVTLVVSFVVGMAVVGAALLFVRAPSGGPASDESPLAAVVVEPAGYVRLDESVAGGGRLCATRAASLLSVSSVPGFRDALLRSWGRPPGEEPRAVVLLAVRLDSAASAGALVRSYAAAAGGTGVPSRDGWVAVRGQDESGRYAQRVAFARDDLVFVVSVVTPAEEKSTREVLALADAQAATTAPPLVL
jgi:hypothetical protein